MKIKKTQTLRLLLTLNLASVVIIIILKNFMPPIVPIFYGKAQGSEQLASYFFLLLPFAFSSLIAGLNYFLSLKVKDNFLAESLTIASIVIYLFSLITVFKIVSIVGFF